jgi:hypothetical protein
MRRLFLVGVPRSGTTFLQSLLGCSPDLATFTESGLFSAFTLKLGRPLLIRSPAALAHAFLAQNVLSTAELKPFGALARAASLLKPEIAGRYFIDVLDRSAAQRGKSAWLEKTPRHLHHIDLIEASLPKEPPQFIHLIRAETDVVPSLVAASRQWGRPMSRGQAQARWRRDIATSLRHASKPNHFVVTYEALAAAPEALSIKLARALAIALTPESLANRLRVLSEITTPDEVWKTEIPRAKEEPNTPERLSADNSAYEALTRLAI